MQLDFDGNEHPLEAVVSTHAPLSDSQREILWHVANHAAITSGVAGRIVHKHRNDGRGCGGKPNALGACCSFMSTDGSDACKCLAERGFLRRLSRGLWGSGA